VPFYSATAGAQFSCRSNAVPGGTGDSKRESKMTRFLTTATIALMLAASGVYAQAPADQQPQRYRTESAWSPLTYEYLGATPSIDLSRLFGSKAAKAEVKKAAEPAAASSKAGPAAATTQARSAHAAEQPATTH
jgi:hypothetical protein